MLPHILNQTNSCLQISRMTIWNLIIIIRITIWTIIMTFVHPINSTCWHLQVQNKTINYRSNPIAPGLPQVELLVFLTIITTSWFIPGLSSCRILNIKGLSLAQCTKNVQCRVQTELGVETSLLCSKLELTPTMVSSSTNWVKTMSIQHKHMQCYL